jgi:hypothetical protein
MPAGYKIDKKHRLVLSAGWGVLTFADVLAHKERLLSDPDFDPDYGQILDFTRVTEMALAFDELVRFSEFEVFSPRSRRALVVLDDVTFGLARVYEMLRDRRGESGIRVCLTVQEALTWVLPSAGGYGAFRDPTTDGPE